MRMKLLFWTAFTQTRRTSLWLLILLLSLLWPGHEARAAAEAKPPSVLVVVGGPILVDFNYLTALHKQEGFNVDYVSSQEEIDKHGALLTWNRLKNYNCVVLVHFVNESTKMSFSKVVDNLCDVLDRYLKEGGGVFLLPGNIDLWDSADIYPIYENTFVKRYGTGFLQQQNFKEENPDNQVKAGYFSDTYFYTDNLTPGPITQGCTGLWYPVLPDVDKNSRGNHTYALSLTPEWQVLVRGSKTSMTVAGDYRFSELNLPILMSKKAVSEPPLFAVRELKKGRMAFSTIHGCWHFVAGMHRNKGGGMEKLTPGYCLGTPLKGRDSCLGKLISNTLRWLSAPSLQSGKLGGYQQDLTRLEEPRTGPSPRIRWDQMEFPSEMSASAKAKDGSERPLDLEEWERLGKIHGTGADYWISAALAKRTFRGLIGARTTYSTGKAGVADFRKAGLRAGLNFIVFLEDFASLTPEKLKALNEDCKKNIDDQFTCIPGFAADDNIGHSIFYYAHDPIWPPPEMIDRDGKRLNNKLTGQNLSHIGHVLSAVWSKGNWGYFNFSPNPLSAPMHDLRLYGAVGLFFYRDGKPVEGLEQNFKNFLDVNNQGCNIWPHAIEFVDQPAGLETAVKEGHFLTCAQAMKPADIMKSLTLSYLRDPTTYISNGPVIREWSSLNRDYFSHADEWITENYRFRVKCDVESENGLAEIRIWDGMKPGPVIRPNGAKRFTHVFELVHDRQKNLILEITDTKGRKAISGEQFDRNHINMHYWCGDRQNGGLFHGPLYFPSTSGEAGLEFTSKGQDSFPLYATPGWGHTNTVKTDQGDFEIRKFCNHPCQAMVSSDVMILTNDCKDTYPPEVPVYIVYGTYGPLVRNELFHMFQTYTKFRNHFGRGHPYIPTLTGIPNQGDIAPGIDEARFTFQKDMIIKEFPLFGVSYGKYGSIAGNKMVVALSRNPKSPVVIARIPDDCRTILEKTLGSPDAPFLIETGGFIATYGSKPGPTTFIQFNVGKEPWVVRSEGGAFVMAYANLAGKKVKKGDTYVKRTLSFAGPVPEPTGAWRYLGIQQYLFGDPRGYEVKVARGKLLPPADGLLDIEVKDGAADFSVPKPKEGYQITLGGRIHGMNDRWSACFYDKVGKRSRPIGTWQNVGYIRIDPDYSPLTDVLVGHPVVADHRDVFITVAQLGESPAKYTVTVDNPTDQEIGVTLKKAMDLPDLVLPDTALKLKPGELKVVMGAGK